MSDTTETVEETVTTPTPDPQQDTTETVAPDEEQGKAGREAAKYRTKLREVEAERDTANETIETLTRELVRMNLPEHLKPEVFWKVNDATPADYLTKDGLNTTLLAEHAEQISKDLGLRDMGLVVEMQTGGQIPEGGNGKKGFESAFSPDRDDD